MKLNWWSQKKKGKKYITHIIKTINGWMVWSSGWEANEDGEFVRDADDDEKEVGGE